MKKTTPFLLTLFLFSQIINAQGAWTKKADIGGGGRYDAISAVISNKAYIGTGFGTAYMQDFWEWNQSSDVWTQKADFGGGLRAGAVGFSIGNKVYIGMGRDKDSLHTDFWEWDQASNNWTKKSYFRGASRDLAVSLKIGNYGYVMGGNNYGQGNLNDFWEYAPTTDSWIQKAYFPGTARQYASGFTIGTTGYILLGGATQNGTYTTDFWSWNQNNNSWTQMSNFSTQFYGDDRAGAVAFSIGTKGYVGTGFLACGGPCTKFLNDFWQWDQPTNTWVKQANFAGTERWSAVGFSIGNKGYIATGKDLSTNFSDIWEWEATATGSAIVEDDLLKNTSVYPNPAKDYIIIDTDLSYPTLEILDLQGRKVLASTISYGSNKVILKDLKANNYVLRITTAEGKSGSRSIMVGNASN